MDDSFTLNNDINSLDGWTMHCKKHDFVLVPFSRQLNKLKWDLQQEFSTIFLIFGLFFSQEFPSIV